jgi:glutamyl/glutaminyl-tRNA synthetase
MAEVVRTRFAPSPTGYLHVGGARTALFNYLLARRLGGKFILRIEDTDQTRNIQAADEKLMEDLRWLGLQWDEGPQVGGQFGPYYQSQRLHLYQQVARQLLEMGRAYYAMETREELEAMRRAAQQRGEKGFRYRRPGNFPSEAAAQRARSEGRPVVVRFVMPEQDFVVPDRILGDVRVAASELSDFVILKADGWPTYHFAVVVDDAAMQVTHVLRGQEHLMNTPNHLALQQALGYPTPVYAHLPIIFNMNGTKMSKRDKDRVVREAVRAAGLDAQRVGELAGLDDAGLVNAWLAEQAPLPAAALEKLARALAVHLPEIEIHDFRRSGYLPEVLVNFIALLGWSPGTNQEKFTLEELCQLFSLERVSRTNARFDREKLLAFNTAALEAASLQRKLAGLRDYLQVNPDSVLSGLSEALLARLIDLCRGMRTFGDIEYKCGPLFMADEAIRYDDKAVSKWLRRGAALLRELREQLATLEDWSVGALESLLREFAAARGLALAKVAQPLRVAVTGGVVSPAIADTLVLLGRQRTLRRIDRALGMFSGQAAQEG